MLNLVGNDERKPHASTRKQITQGQLTVFIAESRLTPEAQVPNVKLRPAQPGASSNSTVSQLRTQHDSWVQDSDEMHQPETQSGVDTCPRPFKGVVVCATGILDKVCTHPPTPMLMGRMIDLFISAIAESIHKGDETRLAGPAGLYRHSHASDRE